MNYFSEIKAISGKKYLSEAEALAGLKNYLGEFQDSEARIIARARKYLELIVRKKPNLVQSLIAQYPLKTEAGYAIMSLAECLDRVPDRKTAYQLIDDKIGDMRWDSGSDNSSLVMNTVAQALKLASKMGGNAVTYTALHSAFKILGKEFILGQDIEAAQDGAKKYKNQGFLLSYDMLGEAARTSAQAEEYLKSYMQAAESAESDSANIFENDGISIKLSALHPRYELLKYEQLRRELLPNIAKIIDIARRRNITVTIDAEEASRLDLVLLLFSELYLDNYTRYHGLGMAVQVYQKQALPALEYLQKLSEKVKIRIPVRLVKGAYWDYEIKKAQTEGLVDYPVFTTKGHTDLSYLACAKFLLANPANFYPQLGTHNVMTIAAIMEIAQDSEFEFQKLYGMGDEVYEQVMPVEKFKCRVYAPVGEQKDLLAYLIRRLLENGANNSFVNQLTQARKNFDSLLVSPFAALNNMASSLKPPAEVFNNRKNSKGYDLGSVYDVESIKQSLTQTPAAEKVADSTLEDCATAVENATGVFDEWNDKQPSQRAAILEKIAESFENNHAQLLKLLMSEARRNISDSLSEIREAVDFCRYYAAQTRMNMLPRKMQSITGEENIYQLHGRGVFICISPWNFPLAIFTGQIAAALVTGNCVIAKPAEQTPKIARLAVKLMHEAGIPVNVLQLITGDGARLGAALVANPGISGVCFTGSTETARIINKSLAENNKSIVPLIAETGGQNCMIVDSTALIERAVDDMIISAFGSAGQRCSALRVAYVQEDIFNELTETLKGAMNELELSPAENFSSDVGEVIDAEAKEKLLRHIERMKQEASLLYGSENAKGNFVPPHLFEIKSISALPEEVFGPVLHVIRYNDLEKIIEEVNSTGYGLTFGIQTRIASRQEYLAKKIKAGNIYANRSMIGAVVESQPFGGHGLSGTGPKAGGPEYLKRFCLEKVVTVNKTAIGGNIDLL